MLGSAVLDVAIGLVFVLLFVSLVVTTANEFVAALLSSRAKWLRTGIERLIGSAFAAKLYDHPLIQGTAVVGTGPSYIPSRTFTGVLLDIVADADKTLPAANREIPAALHGMPADADRDAFIDRLLPALQAMSDAGGTAKAIADDVVDLIAKLPGEGFDAAKASAAVTALLQRPAARYIGSLIANADDPRMQRLLKVLYDDAGGDGAKFKENVEIWFDNAMDRVGGWYKRKSQWVIASIALVVTVAMNVDALLIVQHLNTQSALRDAVVAEAKAFSDLGVEPDAGAVDAQLRKLNLPIGWYRPSPTDDAALVAFRKTNRLQLDVADWSDIVRFHIVGWLLTAIAASLGAPFWFDTLNKIMSIRAAGKAPEERPRAPKQVPRPLEPGQSPRDADAAPSGR